METKTLRLPEEMVKQLTDNGQKMLNPALVEFVQQSFADRKAAVLDIKGVFTPSEWIALADSLNGTMITDEFRYNRDAFIIHCEDAELYESSFSKHGADMKAVCEKIKGLTAIQVATVYRRIEAYWDKCGEIDSQKWSEF